MFRVPHPTQPDMDIVYACIEGAEAPVYARETAHLVDGAIDFKDYVLQFHHPAPVPRSKIDAASFHF
jgi:hypothetical protein